MLSHFKHDIMDYIQELRGKLAVILMSVLDFGKKKTLSEFKDKSYSLGACVYSVWTTNS